MNQWPAKSPNITPCDLFLPAYIKESVHQTPVVNTKDLKNRNAAAIASVDVDMLQHTWLELE
jgi:hypothetical protein